VSGIAQKARVKNDPAYDDNPWHWGYTLGFNAMEFSITHNDQYLFEGIKDNGDKIFTNPSVDLKSVSGARILHADFANISPGFHVGMITDFRLGEYFNFRILPSFIFGQRNVYFFTINNTGTKFDTLLNIQKLESSMVDLPFLFKYKSKRVNNFRPYLIAGASFKYDLAPKNSFEKNEDYMLLNRFDIYCETGFGIDYYLPFFKLSTEIKLSTGFLNVLNSKTPNKPNDAYVNSISSLNSRIIEFSIHIE
jgi:hypothetical protein